MILAVDDDHVLGAAHDVDIAVGQIPHVARVEPAVHEAGGGRVRITEIAVHHRCAAAPYLADRAIGQRTAILVANRDFHAERGAAAIDDRAVTLRTAAGGIAARQLGLLDQFDHDPFAGRHDRHGQRRLRQPVGGQERRRLEPGIGERIDEALHHVRPDHVRPVARHAPARQIEAIGGARLAGHAARADIVAEGGRIAERGAGIAADEIEPGQRAAGEILGLQIIGGHLVGDRREQAADEAHIVIPGQPRDAAIAVAHLHPDRMRGQIAEQRRMRDRDPVRKARRSAAILQIGDVGRGGRGEAGVGRGIAFGERLPRNPLGAAARGGDTGHRRQFGRIEEHARFGTGELDRELIDIAVLAAERGGQRQRHRPCAGIDRAEEQRGKLRPGFGEHRDPIAGAHAGGDQAAAGGARIIAQFGIAIGADERAARIVEIEAAGAAGGIVQRIDQRGEIRKAAGPAVIARRGADRVHGPFACNRIEHPVPLPINPRPDAPPARPMRFQPVFKAVPDVQNPARLWHKRGAWHDIHRIATRTG